MIDFYARLPINKTAGLVTSQKGCVEQDSDLTAKEIAELIFYIARKRRRLEVILSIRDRHHAKNVMYRLNSQKNYIKRIQKKHGTARSLVAWVFLGKEIKRLTNHIVVINKNRL